MPGTNDLTDRIDHLLHQYDMNPDAFYSAILYSLHRSGPPHRPAIPPTLKLDETDLEDAIEQIAAGAFQTYAAENAAVAVAGSDSVATAARLLQIEAKPFADIVEGGRLLTVQIAGSVRVPRWQYTDALPTSLLPGLPAILTGAHTARISAQTLAGFMTLSQPALSAEAALTPRQWLMAGYPADAVLRIIEGWAHR
ncbi:MULTISPECIES: hypothetical protein [unclassified Curtobacterium]|uniref:hypothetical protein n=1 Tax=unclassified Curtobacterium TaxID=257496 RepID=UPI000F48A454|nr:MULTISPECIES: hypothetical protein [unclassified Curtobacterium]ROQ04770.1 hypothetical protein EDF41_3421 [Curtobacterium sp. PhB171]ROQ28280.1 hypothetical protein EDF40_1415 [Curtobacterium sp. PhB170]ROS33187.1 hypothetical protein EDF25_3245 [Curtobacterium sp. PhB131]ROS72423.1 hypothetical protein EDF30_0348 [Curtobacterium sp. PhB141]